MTTTTSAKSDTTLARYRHRLPQLDADRLFLTDGGLETTLIFHEGWELPNFESYVLLDSDRGRAAIRAYFDRYVPLAVAAGAGFVLECPTWRANPSWGPRNGYDPDRLAKANRDAVSMMQAIRAVYETPTTPMPISGNLGPRGDGYEAGRIMSIAEAGAYHAWQVGIFATTAADFVSAFTITNVNEAIGFTRAAQAASIPAVVSFTVETDGRLPTGDALGDAIEAVDSATAASPAYYMINCAHPTHFADTLRPGGAWTSRIRGLRANASYRSHAALDNATELDFGDPVELGRQHRELLSRHPGLVVLGGCCGTDHRHVGEIVRSCSLGKAA